MPFDIYTPAYAGTSTRNKLPLTLTRQLPIFISLVNTIQNPVPKFPLLFIVKTTVHVWMRQRTLLTAPNPINANTFLTATGLLTEVVANYTPLVYNPITTPNISSVFVDIDSSDYGASLTPNTYWPITVNNIKESVLMFYNSDAADVTNTVAPIITINCSSDLTLNGPPVGTSYSLGWLR